MHTLELNWVFWLQLIINPIHKFPTQKKSHTSTIYCTLCSETLQSLPTCVALSNVLYTHEALEILYINSETTYLEEKHKPANPSSHPTPDSITISLCNHHQESSCSFFATIIITIKFQRITSMPGAIHNFNVTGHFWNAKQHNIFLMLKCDSNPPLWQSVLTVKIKWITSIFKRWHC